VVDVNRGRTADVHPIQLQVREYGSLAHKILPTTAPSSLPTDLVTDDGLWH
jgi:hypothetical protein